MNLLDLIHQIAKHSVVFEIVPEGVNKSIRHRCYHLVINHFDIPMQFNGLISISLSLLGQVESLGKLLRVLVLELDGQSVDEFQESVLEHPDVELA